METQQNELIDFVRSILHVFESLVSDLSGTVLSPIEIKHVRNALENLHCQIKSIVSETLRVIGNTKLNTSNDLKETPDEKIDEQIDEGNEDLDVELDNETDEISNSKSVKPTKKKRAAKRKREIKVESLEIKSPRKKKANPEGANIQKKCRVKTKTKIAKEIKGVKQNVKEEISIKNVIVKDGEKNGELSETKPSPDTTSKNVTAPSNSAPTNKAKRGRPRTSPADPVDLTCGVCGRQTRTARELRVHLRVHSDHRPFKCEKCPLSFKQVILYNF